MDLQAPVPAKGTPTFSVTPRKQARRVHVAALSAASEVRFGPPLRDSHSRKQNAADGAAARRASILVRRLS